MADKKKKTKFHEDHPGQFITERMEAVMNQMRAAVVIEMNAINSDKWRRREKRVLTFLTNPLYRDGASIHEFAAGFFRAKYEKNVRYAVQMARQLLQDTNKYCLRQKLYAIHSVKVYASELGREVNRYLLIETEKAYKPIKQKKDLVIDGIQARSEEAREAFRIPLAKRKKLLQQLLDEDEER